jgi:hypothetical protein
MKPRPNYLKIWSDLADEKAMVFMTDVTFFGTIWLGTKSNRL